MSAESRTPSILESGQGSRRIASGVKGRSQGLAPSIPEAYCRWLGRYFGIAGMDREDIAQEARIAAWLAPAGFERLAARRRVISLLRSELRRPRFTEYVEAEAPSSVTDIAEARDRLRSVLAAPTTENERIALGRRLRGDPIRRDEHALDMAWFRLRERLAA